MQKIPEVIHESWHKHLQPLFDDLKMGLIKDKLLPHCKFYPAPENIFRVFEMPLQDIKVVILGQDPYPNGEAIGYAFAVNERKTGTIPASLQVISAELQRSSGHLESKLKTPTLSHWIQQGVFLLNTALTVEVGEPGKHIGQWLWFTREVIGVISREVKPVWLLWGAKAQGFLDYINLPYNGIRPKEEFEMKSDLLKEMNVYFKAYHPAAEKYSGGKNTFMNCNHFNLCNEILERQNKSIINW